MGFNHSMYDVQAIYQLPSVLHVILLYVHLTHYTYYNMSSIMSYACVYIQNSVQKNAANHYCPSDVAVTDEELEEVEELELGSACTSIGEGTQI